MQNTLRRLDLGETQFWLFDRVSTMNFSVFAEIHGNPDIYKIQASLKSVQSLYPLARVGIRKSSDQTSLEFAETSNSIPLSLREDAKSWEEELAKDTNILFDETTAPLLHAYIYLSDSQNWVFSIVFHHSISDGRSGIRFFQDVLREYASLPLETSRKQQSQAMHSIFQEAVLEKIQNSGSLQIPKPMPLPFFAKRKEEPKPKILRLTLENADLVRFRENCKVNAVSIHGILGAMQLKALASLYEAETVSLNLSTPADIRKYLTTTIDESHLGLYITLLTSQLEVGNESTISDLAGKYLEDIQSQLHTREGLLFYSRLSEPGPFLQKTDSIRVFASLMERMPQASVLSNVGVIPDLSDLQDIDIRSLSFTVHPSVTQTIFTTATTFRGRLQIVFNYDSNRWDSERIREFVNVYRELLSDWILA